MMCFGLKDRKRLKTNHCVIVLLDDTQLVHELHVSITITPVFLIFSCRIKLAIFAWLRNRSPTLKVSLSCWFMALLFARLPSGESTLQLLCSAGQITSVNLRDDWSQVNSSGIVPDTWKHEDWPVVEPSCLHADLREIYDSPATKRILGSIRETEGQFNLVQLAHTRHGRQQVFSSCWLFLLSLLFKKPAELRAQHEIWPILCNWAECMS